jgi:alpha-amylase
MQWAYYTGLRRLEPFVKESDDKEFLKLWRYFQTSDHLYYMFTAGGGPGEVHSYFSSFNTPADAFVTAQAAILDFESRVRLATVTANEPFLFYVGEGEENFTGVRAWSLKGIVRAIEKAGLKSVEFHFARGDFDAWAEKSLRDKKLSERLRTAKLAKHKGRRLKEAIIEIVKERLEELRNQAKEAALYF